MTMATPVEPVTLTTFIEQYGLVKYRAGLARKYSRNGSCEICNASSQYLLARYSGNFGKLWFDHCHNPEHWRVRGRLCNRCNNLMGLFDCGWLSPGEPWYPHCVEHYLKCPDCTELPRLIDRTLYPTLRDYNARTALVAF